MTIKAMKEVKLLKLRTLNNTSILFIRIWWSSFLLKWKFVKVNKTKDLGQFSKISILIIIWYCWERIAIGFKADAKWSVHNFFPQANWEFFLSKIIQSTNILRNKGQTFDYIFVSDTLDDIFDGIFQCADICWFLSKIVKQTTIQTDVFWF